MRALLMPWTGVVPVFHVRLGCCGACGDMVDAMLRDTFRGRPPVAECASPRHAGLIIVSGMWNEGLAGPALDVIAQAPEAAKILVVGDCALGRGLLAERLGRLEAVSVHVEADAEVFGCPVSIDAIGEGVRNVTR
jgi:formate hydrogenlyase subunit 7